MKKILTFIVLSLLAVAPAAAQGQRSATPLPGPVKRIVVNGHANLFLNSSKDSISRFSSRSPEKLTYTYSAEDGTMTIDSGALSIWIAPFRTISIESHDFASISVMPGDTLRADNIDILARDYSKINITRPINSDTLKAYSHEHAYISFDALEGFDIDLSDQGFSHITIDRRTLHIKHREKEHKKVLGIF